MKDDEQLTQALQVLGELLERKGLKFDLAVIGGGALFLRNLVRRPTRVASRQDLITLKLWAATNTGRGQRRAVDIHDLQELSPTIIGLREAARWCMIKDGRPDCASRDIAPVITKLGFSSAEVLNE